MRNAMKRRSEGGVSAAARRTAGALALAASLLLALATGARADYVVLANDLAALEARFNQDADKVRVVMLLDPT
jgi:hypothetical protein